jgi:hypothetical protein
MKRSIAALTVGAIVSGAVAGSVSAQSVCRPADYVGNLAEQHLARIVADSLYPGSVYRDSLHLPALSPAAVVRVTDERICARGRAAYAAYWVGRGETAVSQTVYVWQVGDRYVIYDPEYRYRLRDGTYALVVDADFRPLSIFGEVQFVR